MAKKISNAKLREILPTLKWDNFAKRPVINQYHCDSCPGAYMTADEIEEADLDCQCQEPE